MGRPAQGEAFASFVDRQSVRLLRAAWLLCGDWQLAEDLVQSTLLELWRRWEDLVTARSVRAPDVD